MPAIDVKPEADPSIMPATGAEVTSSGLAPGALNVPNALAGGMEVSTGMANLHARGDCGGEGLGVRVTHARG